MNLDPQLQTDKITPELIDYIVAKIVREIQPEKIILYGSYARGDYHEDSDLDLFIVKDGMESNKMLRRHVDRLFRGRLFSLDVRVRKPLEVESNFHAQNPFYLYHIYKDGKVLYDRENESAKVGA